MGVTKIEDYTVKPPLLRKPLTESAFDPIFLNRRTTRSRQALREVQVALCTMTRRSPLTLVFSEHISSACIMASQRIGILMRLSNLIPTKDKLQLYTSAVLPYLAYCHLVWHFRRASDVPKLERLQVGGLRAVYKATHASYFQLLERAKFPTLANRRVFTGHLYSHV